MTTPPAGGSRQPLTEERIAAAALDVIADRGIAGMTMRALGERLGVDPMAPYRHFRDKEEILAAAADRVFAEVPVVDSDLPWDERIVALALSSRDALLRRPGFAAHVAARPPLGPSSLAVVEQLLDALHAGGFDRATATRTAQSVIALVLGTTAAGASRSTPAADRIAAVREAFDAAPDELQLVRSSAEFVGADQDDVGQLRWSLELLVAGLRAIEPPARKPIAGGVRGAT